ncbi:cytochrome c biogenesis CcdA family protein [Bacillus sp. B1-b2]|uniref:cytochrome c biogenesis CcdA family protein n=1 Tax=Bacillus sp. B1-b2 TaxID=2653201 RepID=UPI0039AEC2E9
MAPCQLTGNFTAITYFGKKSVSNTTPWGQIFLFLFGKVLVFSLFGGLIWLLGKEFQSVLTTYFAYFRKSVGFINIIVGLFLLGYLQLTWLNRVIKTRTLRDTKGNISAFLLGISYSVAFCPQ